MSSASELKSKCSQVQGKYSGRQSELTRRYSAWDDEVGIRATNSMQDVSKAWSAGFEYGISGTSRLADGMARAESDLHNIQTSLDGLSNELKSVVSRASSV